MRGGYRCPLPDGNLVQSAPSLILQDLPLKKLGFAWGVLGVVAILLLAIRRISPRIFELQFDALTPLQWTLLVLFVFYMLYAEGYRGFHCNFAPRVVLRASHLHDGARPLALILAPLYCMGFFYATRRRIITSCLVTAAIVSVVIIVTLLPQPWRGIIDAGVVAGLGFGILSIGYYMLNYLRGDSLTRVSADLPSGWLG